ncbi:TIGR04290 family methyltransferase [Flagellimonas baculiformis]|uniref:TIGR04290 family methyltransferase n=1 Tax=Flagellimonas baculiformis TaxID=3067310 RepID=UPI00296E524D|nr:TIGR04290 family methyltransferase [Muricauda sp. D6]
MTTEQQIQQLKPWFHNIHLPDGHQTAPNHFLGDFPSFKWERIKGSIPEDLTGWKVLDVGCNAGYYAVELAKRGAHVVGIDLDDHYLKQAKWVAEQCKVSDRIEFKQMQVYDMAHTDDQYDLIWFMGVLYHLRYPLFALDILSQKTRKMMVVQTLMAPGGEKFHAPKDIGLDEREILEHPHWPSLSFIEHSMAGDPTNWWAPNHSAVRAMLRSCGFTTTAMPEEETYIAVKNGKASVAMTEWNHSEYLSAIGKKWQKEVKKKTEKH